MSINAVRIRIFIVEDHELARAGLRARFAQEADLTCCGEAVGETDAKQLLNNLEPDILIVDIGLKDGNGLDLIKWARNRLPNTLAVVVSSHEEEVYGKRAFKAGARGYVNKANPAKTIVDAVRAVRAGRLFFSESLTDRMLRVANKLETRVADPISLLSNREIAIFSMLGDGLTSAEVATQLHLSRSTVDTYRERIKQKLGLHSATELQRRAFEWQHKRP